MNKSSKTISAPKLIERENILSRPGATVIVKELILTKKGRDAITTGSSGITQGAKELHGPKAKQADTLALA